MAAFSFTLCETSFMVLLLSRHCSNAHRDSGGCPSWEQEASTNTEGKCYETYLYSLQVLESWNLVIFFFSSHNVMRKHQNVKRNFPSVINKVLGFGLMKYETGRARLLIINKLLHAHCFLRPISLHWVQTPSPFFGLSVKTILFWRF